MSKEEIVYDYEYLLKNMINLGRRYDVWKVFNDFLCICAYSISNSVYYNDEREKEYLKIINSYSKDEVDILVKMFSSLVNSLDSERFNDVLGKIFEELNLHNKYKGQFFTPEHVCDLMSKITLNKDEIEKDIKNKGYIKLNDPACGSSRLIYSALKFMVENNINYHYNVFVEVQDVSLICVLMSYIQLSLYGVNGKVIYGDTLTGEVYDVFYMPMMKLCPIKEVVS